MGIYWEIRYINCESNERWTIARSPIDWDKYQVIDSISIGGCGDDVAEILDVIEVENTCGLSENCTWDFCEE